MSGMLENNLFFVFRFKSLHRHGRVRRPEGIGPVRSVRDTHSGFRDQKIFHLSSNWIRLKMKRGVHAYTSVHAVWLWFIQRFAYLYFVSEFVNVFRLLCPIRELCWMSLNRNWIPSRVYSLLSLLNRFHVFQNSGESNQSEMNTCHSRVSVALVGIFHSGGQEWGYRWALYRLRRGHQRGEQRWSHHMPNNTKYMRVKRWTLPRSQLIE